MTKKDTAKIFIDEIYSITPMRNYKTNEITYDHIDEIWSIDFADMINYKTKQITKVRDIYS